MVMCPTSKVSNFYFLSSLVNERIIIKCYYRVKVCGCGLNLTNEGRVQYRNCVNVCNVSYGFIKHVELHDPLSENFEKECFP
jgi:hypothetical protein